jgi:hypothetical protein
MIGAIIIRRFIVRQGLEGDDAGGGIDREFGLF